MSLHSLVSFEEVVAQLVLVEVVLLLDFLNFFKKGFHTSLITKIMLPHPLFIQECELFGIPDEDFIKK